MAWGQTTHVTTPHTPVPTAPLRHGPSLLPLRSPARRIASRLVFCGASKYLGGVSLLPCYGAGAATPAPNTPRGRARGSRGARVGGRRARDDHDKTKPTQQATVEGRPRRMGTAYDSRCRRGRGPRSPSCSAARRSRTRPSAAAARRRVRRPPREPRECSGREQWS